MDASLKTIVGTTCLAIAFSIVGQPAAAQNVYRDYVTDRHAQYSPFDHQERGLIYRMHTGHAGLFGNCDDDRAKMVSPYIDWHCRKSDRLPGTVFARELVTDLYRKRQRLIDGAGACVAGRCNECQQTGSDCNCQESVESETTPVPVQKYDYNARSREIPTPGRLAPNAQTNQSVLWNKPISAAKPQDDPPVAAPGVVTTAKSNVASPGIKVEDREPVVQTRKGKTGYRSIYERQGMASTSPSMADQLKKAPTQRIPSEEDSAKTSRNNALVSGQAKISSNKQSRRRNASLVSRRNQKRSKLPEDKFALIEKSFADKPLPSRYASLPTNKDSRFRLSETGSNKSLENRAQSEQGTESKNASESPKVKHQEPVQDRPTDPRYFQFQQIGGSKYR